MKKLIIIAFILLGISTQMMSQPEQVVLENEKSWTMIVLPDTQTYMKFEQNQPIFDIITRWIKLNKDVLNIELVLCEGDLVEQNNILVGDGLNGDQNSQQQWTSIRDAFSVLDTVVPYILCTGNHDYGSEGAENRYSQFNSFFPPNKSTATYNILSGMMPNSTGEKTLENAYYDFTSPHGIKYLIMSLEFNARDTIVQQAKTIVSQDKYLNHRGIVLTHSYMYSMADDNELVEKEDYKVKDVTHGKRLWEQLIEPSVNIEMVFCGHIAGIGDFKKNVGYRNDKNAKDKPVHQMLFNAQADGGGWYGNGGDGWIRILEFLPDKKTVIVKTFSPLFAISPITINKAWRTEAYDQFRFELAE